jgi:hypothetical protein
MVHPLEGKRKTLEKQKCGGLTPSVPVHPFYLLKPENRICQGSQY